MPKPWEGEGGSFGSWLRQQREIRNINLREISDNTKIAMRYLEALEEDRFEVLPAPIFAKGFLREYAKYVGLDPDEVVNFYLTAEQRHRAERGDDESGVHPLPSHYTAPVSTAPPPNPLPWLIGAVVIVLALVIGGVTWYVKHHQASTPAPAEEPQAVVTPTPPLVSGSESPTPPLAPITAPSPPPPLPVTGLPPGAQPLVVSLTFTAECWVDAVADGTRHISELRVQGESMRIEARDSVVLTLGNAGAVRGEVNGRPLRLAGAPGQVVRDLRIDRTAGGLPPLSSASPGPSAPG